MQKRSYKNKRIKRLYLKLSQKDSKDNNSQK